MRYLLLTVFSVFLIGCGQTSVRQVVKDVEPGVVMVVDDLGATGSGMGTGFILDDNQIVTNNHVIEQTGKLYVFSKNSKRKYEAEVVYKDPIADLAVLRLLDWELFKKNEHPVNLTLGDSDKMLEGDKAVVIGHPWGLEWSVSEGIVSAKERRIGQNPKFLDQIDAHLFQGNSGGPIFNLNGEIVCVSNIMISKEGGSYGLCIPSNLVKKVLYDFNAFKEIRWRALNVSVGLTDDGSSVIFKSVEPNGAAGKAGVKDGDKVLEIITPRTHPAGLEVKNPDAIITEMAKQYGDDDIVKLVIERNGEKMMIDVKTNYRVSSEYTPDQAK